MRVVATTDDGGENGSPDGPPPLRLVRDGERPEPTTPWRILVVDDDEEMHRLVRLIAGSLSYEGRSVDVVSAHTAAQARRTLTTTDVSVVLLDVVMETDNAGLDLVEHIRLGRNDTATRIIIVTGQPGVAPEPRVIRDYDINGYLNKAEIESQQIASLIITSLRMYSDFTRMQDLADQARRAELDSEAKSEFIAAMNHELRNPLQTIIGHTELLQSGGLDDRSAWEAGLAEIDRAGRHMLSLVDEILELAADERPGAGPSLRSVPVAVVARDACALMRQLADERGITMIVDVPDGLPPTLGNERRIMQVLINLISNAVKYNRPDGEVVVSARAAGAGIELAVEDTGVGIPEELRDRIFVPFERLSSDESGTGIGLHITQRLLRQMGSELEVVSSVGEGSRFSFRLDAAP